MIYMKFVCIVIIMIKIIRCIVMIMEKVIYLLRLNKLMEKIFNISMVFKKMLLK